MTALSTPLHSRLSGTSLTDTYDVRHHERHVSEPRWATVRVMILLGDKYDVPTIHAEGLKQLRAWYAQDIHEWDKRDEAFFAHETDHLAVASITRTLGELDLHVAVLYHCCSLPPSLLVAGNPTTGCPPLCAEDLARALAYARGTTVFCRTFLLGTSIERDLLLDIPQCANCSLRLIRPSLRTFLQASQVTKMFKFLELAMWNPLAQALRPHLCDTCMSSYNVRLTAFRQAHRLKLNQCFE